MAAIVSPVPREDIPELYQIFATATTTGTPVGASNNFGRTLSIRSGRP